MAPKAPKLAAKYDCTAGRVNSTRCFNSGSMATPSSSEMVSLTAPENNGGKESLLHTIISGEVAQTMTTVA